MNGAVSAVQLQAGSADPRASEEVRALMQERFALLGRITLALSGANWILSLVVDAMLLPMAALFTPVAIACRSLHASAALVSLGMWAISARGRRTPRVLLWTDVLGTAGCVVPYTLMSVLCDEGMAAVLMASLTLILVLLCRALLIPSD